MKQQASWSRFYVADSLTSEVEMVAYLQAALEDGDPALLTAAFDDVERARAKPNNQTNYAYLLRMMKKPEKLGMTDQYAYKKLMMTLGYIYEHGSSVQSLRQAYSNELGHITPENDLPSELREQYKGLCSLFDGLPNSENQDADREKIKDSLLDLYGRLYRYPDYTPD